MRFSFIICLTLSIFGCSENRTPRSPTAPTPPRPTAPQPTPPPPSTLIQVWGYVVTSSGECIEGATVEVVSGPILLGQKATQTTPCDRTNLRGGFVFDEGVPGGAWDELTLRASAPGYVSQEQNLSQWPWDTIPTFTLVRTGG